MKKQISIRCVAMLVLVVMLQMFIWTAPGSAAASLSVQTQQDEAEVQRVIQEEKNSDGQQESLPLPQGQQTNQTMQKEVAETESKTETENREMPKTEQITVTEQAMSVEDIPIQEVGMYDMADSMTMYESFDYSDPQFIDDKLLFGQWDKENAKWIPQTNTLYTKNGLGKYYGETCDKPLLNYEKYPELSAVEAAVKECDGNYNKPKALLLQYYREKFGQMNRETTFDSSRSATLNAIASAYNFSTAATVALDIFDVTAEKRYYCFDVKSAVSETVAATAGRQYTFMLEAMQLDEATAAIESKESTYKPYMVLELSDGSTRTLYPTDDTYIQAGGGSGTNYGAEQNLLVSERHNKDTLADDFKRFAMLKFDFSSVESGLQVNDANLYLCAQTDKETPQRIMLAQYKYIDWEEGTANYNNVPVADNNGEIPSAYDIFSGIEPANNTISATKVAQNLAKRYLADGKEEFAYHGIRQLISIYRLYSERTYNYSSMITVGSDARIAAEAVYSFIDSDYMTPEIFAALLKYMYYYAEWLTEGWNWSGNVTSNHGTYYNLGYAAIICNFPEFRKVDDPIIEEATINEDYTAAYYGGRGGWIGCLQRRLIYKVNGMVLSDGSGAEVSDGYNMQAYGNNASVLQQAVETGMTGIFPDEFYKMMAKMALSFVITTPPGYGSWQIGNSYGNESDFIHRNDIKYLVDALETRLKVAEETGDTDNETYQYEKEIYDQIIWAYSDGKKGKEPAQTSMLFPVQREAIFRSNWEKTAVSAHFNISNGGTHGHFNDLGLIIEAYGKYLLVDSFKMDYTFDSPYRAWLNSTRAHNTIEINDISQASGLWNNSEVVPGPGGERIVLPHKDKPYVTGVSSDAELQQGEYPEVIQIIEERNYTDENLYTYYETEKEILGNPTDKRLQGRFLQSNMNSIFDYVKGTTESNIDVTYTDQMGYFGEENAKYAGVDNIHSRSVLFVRPEFFIVTDFVAPVNGNTGLEEYGGKNKYNQTWHFADDANITMERETNVVKTNYNDVNLAVVPVSGKETPIEAELVNGWYITDKERPAQYASYVKYSDKPTTFNTILFPMNNGKDYDFQTETIALEGMSETEASAFSFQIKDKATGDVLDGIYYNLHDNQKQMMRSVGDYQTDGRMLYIDKGGLGYQTLALLNGTEVRGESDEILIKSLQNISELGVMWKGTTLELATSRQENSGAEKVDLNQFTVRAPNTVKKVIFNGEEIAFQQQGGYVYFGDNPIIEDGEEPTPEPTVQPTMSVPGHGGPSGGTSGNTSSETPTVTPTPTSGMHDPMPSENFSEELEAHWAKDEITAMVNAGIVKGISETSLGLEQATTRAEFITLLLRAFKIEPQEYHEEFADIIGTEWYAGYIAAAWKLGILSGDGQFAFPNQYITREEMAKILVNMYELQYGKFETVEMETTMFTDIEIASDWAKPYIFKAVEAGLMNGISDTVFAPHAIALREQSIVVIYRLLQKEA